VIVLAAISFAVIVLAAILSAVINTQESAHHITWNIAFFELSEFVFFTHTKHLLSHTALDAVVVTFNSVVDSDMSKYI